MPRDRWSTFEGLEKDKLNVLYCYSQVCHLAAKAAVEFTSNGYSVMELEGGFECDEWLHGNYAVTPVDELNNFFRRRQVRQYSANRLQNAEGFSAWNRAPSARASLRNSA